MAKFDSRFVASIPATSTTVSELGPSMDQYVWDPKKQPQQDPFFAIKSVVISAPAMSFTTDDDSKISITF
jgi:hypothetical protein